MENLPKKKVEFAWKLTIRTYCRLWWIVWRVQVKRLRWQFENVWYFWQNWCEFDGRKLEVWISWDNFNCKKCHVFVVRKWVMVECGRWFVDGRVWHGILRDKMRLNWWDDLIVLVLVWKLSRMIAFDRGLEELLECRFLHWV